MKKRKYKKLKTEKTEKKFSLDKKYLLVLVLVLFLVLIFSDFLAIRYYLPRQIDDVHPFFDCESGYINKSDILMVIPLYKNFSITNSPAWCKELKVLNKTIGMHGVYHSYQEFLEFRDEEYIKKGMEQIKKCFGVYPTVFEAPQLVLSEDNKKLLESMGFEVVGYGYSLTHKVYHCSDQGKFRNWLINIF